MIFKTYLQCNIERHNTNIKIRLNKNLLSQFVLFKSQFLFIAFGNSCMLLNVFFCYAPEGTSGGILKSHLPSVRQSVRSLQIVSQRYLISY